MANNPQKRNRQRDEQGQYTSKQRSNRQGGQSQESGPGRGWHGDSEGHARAGSQSHKNKP